MKKIGVSILTFKNGEKNGTFFNAIISNIKNQSNISDNNHLSNQIKLQLFRS